MAKDIKQILQDAILEKKKRGIIKEAEEVAASSTKRIAEALSPDDVTDAVVEKLAKAIQPVLTAILEKDRATSEDIIAAIKEIELSVPKADPITFPEQKAPIVNVPAPIVNVPAPVVNFPELKFPEQLPYPEEMKIKGLNPKNPLPVQLVDMAGKPYFPSDSSASGGRGDFFTIKGFSQSAFAEITNPDGRLKVELPSGASGLTDTELRAAHLDVQQLSGSADSVNVISTVGLTNTELRAAHIDVTQTSGTTDSVNVVTTVGLTDTQLRAAHIDTQQVSGAIDSVYITDIAASAWAGIQNGDGRLRVSVETGGSGLTDAELRATAVPVSQLSGAAWSVSVNDIFGSVATNLINPDNRLKVELPTGSSGLTDTELRATAVPVSQLSGAAWSVSVNDIFGSVATNVVNPDGRLKVELPTGSSGLTDTELRASHLDVDQLSGSSWSTVVNSGTLTAVTSITNSVAVVNLDRDGNPTAAYQVYPVATGLNETNANVLRTVQMTDAVSSVNIAAQGVTLHVRQLSGASDSVNVLAGTITTVTTVTSITNSVAVTGNVASDVADNGDGPIKTGGIARTANPTAVAAGDRVSSTYDDLGRQVTRPIQVRDLTRTAYVTTTTGVETTLLAASAGSYHDCIMITATNGSTAAVTVDIRAVTGGNIVHTMVIPASTGPVGWSPAVPWPQDETGNNWTVDVQGSDVSNTSVYFTGLFSREV